MSGECISMTLAEWKEKYKPIGEYCEGLDLTDKKIKPNTVWTECDAGYDNMRFIINRQAVVNAESFWITKIPYNPEDEIMVNIKVKKILDKDGELVAYEYV